MLRPVPLSFALTVTLDSKDGGSFGFAARMNSPTSKLETFNAPVSVYGFGCGAAKVTPAATLNGFCLNFPSSPSSDSRLSVITAVPRTPLIT